MKRLVFFTFLLIPLLKLFAQEESEHNSSGFQYNKESDYFYNIPLDFNSAGTELVYYPLVIYLHGGGGNGNLDGLDFLGYSSGNAQEDKVAQNFQTNYPSFILVPQSQRGWEASKIIPIVENFKSKYPIDNKRIYLIGYSMGGSGSYSFANDYFDYNQTLFAAIIRLAGQSQTILRDEIASKTSVWIHIGLDDDPKRINISREAYNYLKLKNPKAKESKSNVTINGITGTTLTLTKSRSEIIKKTEYNKVGHGISRFPFDDKKMIAWLFNHKLD